MSGPKDPEEYRRWKERLRVSKLGDRNPSFGKSDSEETREKKRQATLERGKDPEYRERQRLATLKLWQKPEYREKVIREQLISQNQEETRRKKSESLLGEKHPMYGKKHSPEARAKQSIAKKGKPLTEEHKRHIGEMVLGHLTTEEGRQKQRVSQKRNHLNGVYEGVNYFPKRANLRYRDRCYRSQPEVDVQRRLDELSIESQYEPRVFDLGDDLIYTPDFYLPRYDAWIEVKGYMKDTDEQKIVRFGLEYRLELLWGWNDEILEQLETLLVELRTE